MCCEGCKQRCCAAHLRDCNTEKKSNSDVPRPISENAAHLRVLGTTARLSTIKGCLNYVCTECKVPDDIKTKDPEDLGTGANVYPGIYGPGKYKVGDAVEVYSRSAQKWCPGKIVSINVLYEVTYTDSALSVGDQERAKGILPGSITDMIRKPQKSARRLTNQRYRDSPVPLPVMPLTGIRKRLANRRYRDSPVLTPTAATRHGSEQTGEHAGEL